MPKHIEFYTYRIQSQNTVSISKHIPSIELVSLHPTSVVTLWTRRVKQNTNTQDVHMNIEIRNALQAASFPDVENILDVTSRNEYHSISLILADVKKCNPICNLNEGLYLRTVRKYILKAPNRYFIGTPCDVFKLMIPMVKHIGICNKITNNEFIEIQDISKTNWWKNNNLVRDGSKRFKEFVTCKKSTKQHDETKIQPEIETTSFRSDTNKALKNCFDTMSHFPNISMSLNVDMTDTSMLPIAPTVPISNVLDDVIIRDATSRDTTSRDTLSKPSKYYYSSSKTTPCSVTDGDILDIIPQDDRRSLSVSVQPRGSSVSSPYNTIGVTDSASWLFQNNFQRNRYSATNIHYTGRFSNLYSCADLDMLRVSIHIISQLTEHKYRELTSDVLRFMIYNKSTF